MNDSESRYFGDSLLNLVEAAPILAQKFNEVTRRCSTFQQITDEEMAALLELHVDPKEFNSLIETEFGQGILVGKILTINDVSIYLEDADEDEADS
jgi:hypothetical protein